MGVSNDEDDTKIIAEVEKGFSQQQVIEISRLCALFCAPSIQFINIGASSTCLGVLLMCLCSSFNGLFVGPLC